MKKIISFILVSLLLCTLAGCSTGQPGAAANDSQTATDSAFIVLQGDGMPAVTRSDADSLINELCVKTGGSATLIVADGAPQIYGPARFDEVKNNSIQQARVDEQYRADILQAIQNVSAKTPETDLIRALQLASRAVKSGSAPRKSLVILHSGINTAFSLPMQQLDLLATEPEQLVDRLADAGMVADFSDVEIDFFGLGDTAGSQPVLSMKQIQFLQDFWNAYFTRTGATQITFHTDVITGQANVASGHTVSPVPVTGGLDWELTSEQIEFVPDSIELLDPQAAQDALVAVVGEMRQSNSCFLIAGSTAETSGSDPGSESALQLSLSRAQAVRDLLVGMGIPEARFECVGLGNKPTTRRSANQADNRCVYIVEAASPEAAEFRTIGLAE